MTRPRTRASAKQAGSKLERQVADYLAAYVDDRIDRRVKTGAKDRGDIAAVRTPHGRRVIIECKNYSTSIDLAGWMAEAEIERGNDDAHVALIAHKRHGNDDPGGQWVTCTLRDLVALLTGERPDDD